MASKLVKEVVKWSSRSRGFISFRSMGRDFFSFHLSTLVSTGHCRGRMQNTCTLRSLLYRYPVFGKRRPDLRPMAWKRDADYNSILICIQ